MILALTIMLIGCSVIKSADIPKLQTGSPLKSISPKVFAFKEFKDIRGTDPHFLWHVGVRDFTLDQPIAKVVAEAIKQEFERNGHRCIDYAPQSKADYTIEGTVYKYSLLFNISFVTTELIASTAVKLTVSHTSPNKGIFSHNYEYESRRSDTTGGPQSQIDIMVQALPSLVKEISTDQKLVEFLQK
ncbi:MAG: YajG family lipoprotein [Parcubacteria group bacterium]